MVSNDGIDEHLMKLRGPSNVSANNFIPSLFSRFTIHRHMIYSNRNNLIDVREQ